MAAAKQGRNRKYLYLRFVGRHLELPGSIRNSAIEVVDYENVEVAVGTALLSCLEAEI